MDGTVMDLWMAWSVLLGAVKTPVSSGVEQLADPVHSVTQTPFRRSEFRVNWGDSLLTALVSTGLQAELSELGRSQGAATADH